MYLTQLYTSLPDIIKTLQLPETHIAEFANSVDLDEVALVFDLSA